MKPLIYREAHHIRILDVVTSFFVAESQLQSFQAFRHLRQNQLLRTSAYLKRSTRSANLPVRKKKDDEENNTDKMSRNHHLRQPTEGEILKFAVGSHYDICEVRQACQSQARNVFTDCKRPEERNFCAIRMTRRWCMAHFDSPSLSP